MTARRNANEINNTHRHQSANTKRFTFELGEDGETALEEIRVATGTSSKSEVLRDALALYEILVDKARQGSTLFVGTDRNNATEIVVPSLNRAAKLVQGKSRKTQIRTT